MKCTFKFKRRLSLLEAIAVASLLSSIIVAVLSFYGTRSFLTEYVRSIVRGNQATIESFFTESISQQILVGDGPEVLRKCHTLLREDFVRAVYIKDLSGETICNLKKSSDNFSIRWSKSPIFFDEEGKNLATTVWLAFSTQSEERLIWVAILSAILSATLLLVIQILLTIPLLRRILQPLADISTAVNIENPEEIQLPKIQIYKPLVVEVWTIFQSMQEFLNRFQLYRNQLIESTRYETVANTVQIIAHDLKAPMAAFERLTRIPESQFGQEKKHLVQALQQLYAMTDSIKHAEFEDVVHPKTDELNLESITNSCLSIAEKHDKTLTFVGNYQAQMLDIDQPKLHRAISNLVINAIESCIREVVVTTFVAEDYLKIVVEDDGMGVPLEFQAHLFSRGATLGKSAGTGLGLHYARRVAQGHGGDITYSRTDGKTQFSIILPRNKGFDFKLENSIQDSINTTKDSEESSVANFLIVVLDESRAAALKLRTEFVGIDIFTVDQQSLYADKPYKYIFCEDWLLAPHLKSTRQKILIEPTDSIEKLLQLFKRFKALS